jgi:ubiquinone/menaquinone biosynthesis C-methylase UbiE
MKGKVVLDLGTPWPFRKELKDYKKEFTGVHYFSLGYKTFEKSHCSSPHVDGDICQLPFKTESADGIICKEVLEHVYNPFLAVQEMFRILKKGGKAFCTLPFVYPYHGSGLEKDFWRFSRDGIDYLFSPFKEVRVIPSGGYFYILQSFLPIPVNRILFNAYLMPMINCLDKMFIQEGRTSIWMVLAEK